MYHPPGAEVLHSGVSEVQRCVKPGVQSGPRILSYRYVFHRITQFLGTFFFTPQSVEVRVSVRVSVSFS